MSTHLHLCHRVHTDMLADPPGVAVPVCIGLRWLCLKLIYGYDIKIRLWLLAWSEYMIRIGQCPPFER